jgi:hypothetical protein
MDTKVPNFGVSVTEKGTKSYFLVARFPGSDSGPTRREIDKVGAITLADARDRAQKWNNLIADGKDRPDVVAGAGIDLHPGFSQVRETVSTIYHAPDRCSLCCGHSQ